MAQEIKLPAKKTAADLMARATGAGSKLPQVPPPAQGTGLPAGQQLPLPVGKPIGVRTALSLTASERKGLEEIGWDESMPIPSNMADIVAQVKAEMAAESIDLPLPVDPTQPRFVPPEPQDFETLPNAEKQRLSKILANAAGQDAARAAEAEAAAKRAKLPLDAQAAYKLVETPSTPRDDTIEVDVPFPTDASPAQPQAAPAAPPTPPSPTGIVPPTDCPHCKKGLAEPVVPEPPYVKKLAFLHSVLGQKCFTDEAILLGGTLVVTFRTLTIQEIDAIYKQAGADLRTGRITEDVDYWEWINRYRMLLQLSRVKTTGAPGVPPNVQDLPDGLSKELNSMCTAVWSAADEPPPGETILPQINTYVVENILKTEAMFRIVNIACNKFNRMVALLEGMVDNSDFWKPTEEQS